METERLGDKGRGRLGDWEIWRLGDKETGRQGDRETVSHGDPVSCFRNSKFDIRNSSGHVDIDGGIYIIFP
jgi:hypothetical protein